VSILSMLFKALKDTVQTETFAKPAASEVGSQRKRSLLLDLCVLGQRRPQSLALPDHIRASSGVRQGCGSERKWRGLKVLKPSPVLGTVDSE
jgi:hypothetical protein